MKLTQKLAIGTAMATLALTGLSAHAQDTMQNDGAMMNSTMTTPTMMPMLVSGTVTRYYVDRGGYVSAMDVQTADGTRMVRFMPSMAQRVTSIYPVGSTASVYVTSRMMGTMSSYDLAGVGPDMPTPSSMMMPNSADALDMLKAMPYVNAGAKRETTTGKLTGYVSDPQSGEILAIVLNENTLVRIPLENRLLQASTSPMGITPLTKNALVVATGYEEAPMYGVMSPFAKRVAATGISVNGQTLGPLGFGKIMSKNKPLLGFNLNLPILGGQTPDEVTANNMGYSTYTMPANSTMPASGMDSGAMMNNDTTMNNGATMNNDTTMTNDAATTPAM